MAMKAKQVSARVGAKSTKVLGAYQRKGLETGVALKSLEKIQTRKKQLQGAK